MPNLFVYNSLSRAKEEFNPLDPEHIRMYACGPTVYNYAHIGNARMAVVFDALARLLKELYPRVTYVSNITDVDDKIIQAAHETGSDISDITTRFTKIYNDHMLALGCLLPDIQPKATEHIPDMIDMITNLIAHDYAYENEGHVLFHVPSYPEYGALSGRSRDEQIAGARVDVAPYKKDPADFVLWKPSNDDQPGWDSPWGRGRPGWHIECSAMAKKHLGLPFDIHGGGADLKFPHHENEIAQSVCECGHGHDPADFAKIWMHNGFLTVNGEKMSKSLGNVVLVHDLLEQKIEGEVARMALLSAHYRQPLDWGDKAIQQAKVQLDRFYQTLHDLAPDDETLSGKQQNNDSHEPDGVEAFLKSLCDDLNTPKAFAVLNSICQRANTLKDPAAAYALKKAGNILGLLHNDPSQWLGYGQCEGQDAAYIDDLLVQRQKAREDKNYMRADEIRDQLDQIGVIIEDTPSGPKWRKSK